MADDSILIMLEDPDVTVSLPSAEVAVAFLQAMKGGGKPKAPKKPAAKPKRSPPADLNQKQLRCLEAVQSGNVNLGALALSLFGSDSDDAKERVVDVLVELKTMGAVRRRGRGWYPV